MVLSILADIETKHTMSCTPDLFPSGSGHTFEKLVYFNYFNIYATCPFKDLVNCCTHDVGGGRYSNNNVIEREGNVASLSLVKERHHLVLAYVCVCEGYLLLISQIPEYCPGISAVPASKNCFIFQWCGN